MNNIFYYNLNKDILESIYIYSLLEIQRKNRDWHNQWSEVKCNFENTMASLLQFWDWLEDKRSKDDEMSI